jgi:3-phosphoshikimate 1-carboxyvinyltransferase
MGAIIDANDNKLPLKITGGSLNGINYNSPIASAQVKSCILFAGLFAEGETTVREPYKSRDHSERMLEYLGADIIAKDNSISIKKSELSGNIIEISNDISSAAFFMVAAAICPNSKLLIKNVGINPTRAGIIEVMKNMNANIAIQNKRTFCNEPAADILIEYSEELKGTTIEGEIIPRLIDELPIIAILATQAEGVTIVKNAEELKNKESDRIKLVCEMVKAFGGDITPTEDGFIINGKTDLKGDCSINPNHDHRIAMSAYIAGLICKKPIKINEFQWVNISFPEFLDLSKSLIIS